MPDIIWIIIIGILHLESPHFILHTEPSVSPPEFSIICQSYGGPATTIRWLLSVYYTTSNNTTESIIELIETEESQLIMNTSRNTTYENRLLVSGRYNGTWTCTVMNNYIRNYFLTAKNLAQQIIKITGMILISEYVS